MEAYVRSSQESCFNDIGYSWGTQVANQEWLFFFVRHLITFQNHPLLTGSLKGALPLQNPSFLLDQEFKRALALFYFSFPLSLKGEGDKGGEVTKSLNTGCSYKTAWPK